ncbi:MAG TPA: efflux RND transporter periplasmic adaptor subunit, partial [Candidatus Edwardsbacteria bacterium]|nr:efflux RND transporter periplasmic adaptor subunit [Candidatus Edwardsbacteria bacterium]
MQWLSDLLSNKRKMAVAGAAAFALLVVAIIVVRVVAGASAAGRRQNAPVVQAQPPRSRTIAATLRYTGDVVAIQQATIVARISGVLQQVDVNLGSSVEQGQLLAVIDSSEVFQQAQQATASYVTARADFDRMQQLFDQKLASQQQYDNSQAQMKVAQATYELAKMKLGYARVTAPFAGYVTKRFLDPGAQLAANASNLFTLMDLNRVKVSVDIMEKDVPLVAAGKKAVIEADALPGQQLTGTVARLAQAVDPATRTMEIEIVVPNPDRLLKPGMYATVTIVLGEHANALAVPSQAVLTDDKGDYVYVLADKTARRVPVTTGQDQDSLTEIVSGLTGAEQVITTGQQFVKDG